MSIDISIICFPFVAVSYSTGEIAFYSAVFSADSVPMLSLKVSVAMSILEDTLVSVNGM